jgi:hypothetical protein
VNNDLATFAFPSIDFVIVWVGGGMEKIKLKHELTPKPTFTEAYAP